MIAHFNEGFLRELLVHPIVGLNLPQNEVDDVVALLKQGQVYSLSKDRELKYNGTGVFSLEILDNI